MSYLSSVLAIEESTINRKKDQNYYKIASCIQVLKHSISINEAFMNNIELTDKKDVLIHLFGLLQNLFVSIDALYDISKATMSHRYSVNLNLNKTLHELKYIRNDIVGHPTHRTYNTGGFGFSLMNMEETTMKFLKYETHIYKREKHDYVSRVVNTEELISEFLNEAEDILHEINVSISDRVEKGNISILIYEFIADLNIGKFNYQLLSEISEIQKNNVNASQTSHHRILWRIDLLYVLDNWKEKNKEKQEMIEYMKLQQAIKIYEMACVIEKIEPKYVKTVLPSLLDSFYRFIKNDERRMKFLSYLKDFDHPYHQSDLDELIEDANQDSRARTVLNWLKRQQNEHKVFLLGSELEKYDKNK
ncbi:MAG: hypothetical protein WCZ13_01585 [Acholeplasmataceae bacterium]